MPYLKAQIQLINSSLKKTAFADARFQNGRYEAIVYDAVIQTGDNKRETIPVIMDDNYLPVDISIDDTYPIVVYHRVLTSSYTLLTGAQFGSGNPTVRQLNTVKMVVYGKYGALKLTREALEALIVTNFPDNINPPPFQLSQMLVQFTGSNYNSRQLWNEEYQGVDFRLSAEDIFFSINYTMQSIFKKGCFKICDCD